MFALLVLQRSGRGQRGAATREVAANGVVERLEDETINLVLSAAVMAHPLRAERARFIASGTGIRGASVVLDPEPGATPSALRSAALAWAAVDSDTSHHLVLQDDVVLCSDFTARVFSVVARVTESPVFLFADWASVTAQAVRFAAAGNYAFSPHVDAFPPCQAVVMPSGLAREFAAFLDSYVTDPLPDGGDARALQLFLSGRGVRGVVAVPNLVEHDSEPSLIGNDILVGARKSALFADDADQNAVDGVLPTPRVLPQFSSHEGRTLVWFNRGEGWTSQPAQRWLSETRLLPDGGLSLYNAQFRRRVLDVTGQIAESLLFEAWLASWLTGALLHQTPAADPGRGPFVASLKTMVEGGMRRAIPINVVEESLDSGLHELLAVTVREAYTCSPHWRSFWEAQEEPRTP